MDIQYLKEEVLGRTNSPFSFYITWPAQRATPPTILRCSRNMFTEPLLSNDTGTHTETHRISFNTTRTVQKRRL
jgi:hypothetical protein